MTNVEDYRGKVDPTILQLREERIKRKIKQKDLASTLDLNTDSTLSSYESGQVTPRISFVRDWAYALDFQIELVPIEKPSRGRRNTASSADDIPADLMTVHLSRYQTALAMGILIGQSGALRTDSPGMAADLQVIADILARSIH